LHRLLGHIGVKGLGKAVDGIEYEDETPADCEVCSTANITRSPFPDHTQTRSKVPIERVHMDLCGPLPTSYDQFKYFYLIIDDYSRYAYLFNLKFKSEAFEKFKIYKNTVENIHNSKIRFIRSDNAPEFVKGLLQNLAEESGIIFEKTVPEAHQQNGVAERGIRTCACMIRAMLIDSKLSQYWWPFAAQYATYIKNRVPHKALPAFTTPYQLWFNRRPNISNLIPFGSRCTMRIVSTNTRTLDPRGTPGKFLGVDPFSKGYLLWDETSRTIRTRRDVKFHISLKGGTTDNADYSVYSPIFDADIGNIPELAGNIPELATGAERKTPELVTGAAKCKTPELVTGAIKRKPSESVTGANKSKSQRTILAIV
jgi:hypothetical protein